MRWKLEVWIVVCLCLCLSGIQASVVDKQAGPPPDSNLQPRFTPARTFPGMADFPSHVEFKKLLATLQSSVLFPTISGYAEEATTYNIRIIRFPYCIVMAETIEDIQKVMSFAKRFNLMVTILSSGHDYVGRSTYDGSIQINLKKMRAKTIELNSTRHSDGEIKVQSGASWMEVYKEVDKVNRVVVGGSAHTVSMGGYTQGGGHSPIVRTFGLAVDNLLEATVVLVDGRIATVSENKTVFKDLQGQETESCDTSLFWALRGGGGGVWGVVVDFTFKLHPAPERVRRVYASWLLRIGSEDKGIEKFGEDTIKFVLREANKLCPQWGGYILFSDGYVPGTNFHGFLTVFMNHFGNYSDPCNRDIDGILNYNISQNQVARDDTNYKTFLEYEVTAQDPPSVTTYIVNSFIQPDSITDDAKLDTLTDVLLHLDRYPGAGCTGVLIGGKSQSVAAGVTPVHPGFRSGLMSLTCGTGWDWSFTNDTVYVDAALRLSKDLKPFGDGTYYNEPDEDMVDWKQQYWGSNDTYCRLATIKKEYDPDNFLWCHNCVMSDFHYDCPVDFVWRQALEAQNCNKGPSSP